MPQTVDLSQGLFPNRVGIPSWLSSRAIAPMLQSSRVKKSKTFRTTSASASITV